MLVVVDNQEPQFGFHKASAIGGGLGSTFVAKCLRLVEVCGGLNACWFAYLVCAICAEKITTLHTDFAPLRTAWNTLLAGGNAPFVGRLHLMCLQVAISYPVLESLITLET